MRFNGDDDENFPGEWALWEANAQRAFKGRRGQSALRDLREALLALAEPMLIEGRLADEQGHVCAVGALAAHRLTTGGKPRHEVLKELSDDIEVELDDRGTPHVIHTFEAEEATVDVAVGIGVPRPLAIEMSSTNDGRRETPHERYQRVLRWTDRHIHAA